MPAQGWLSAGGSGRSAASPTRSATAADNGAKVINMSAAGAVPSAVLKKAVKYAFDKGVTVVCAAGKRAGARSVIPPRIPARSRSARTQSDRGVTFYLGTTARTSNRRARWHHALGGRRSQQPRRRRPPEHDRDRRPVEEATTTRHGTSMASPHAAGVAGARGRRGVTESGPGREDPPGHRAQAVEPDVQPRQVRRRHHRRPGGGQGGALEGRRSAPPPRPSDGGRRRRVGAQAGPRRSISGLRG